ncbi:MAG: hypothetical protein JW829_17425 [Pirellulales bacterium]|nr:hypothetical protein [Pirellulales bacterium]
MNPLSFSLHTNMGRVVFCSVMVGLISICSFPSDTRGQSFTPPNGGWAYTYAGDTAANPADAALDGTWNHHNGSDEWDGTGPGTGNPGGAGVFTDSGATYLRIQDTGNLNDGAYGIADPSNRKIYLTHDLSGIATSSLLDDGVTLSFRARISTSGTLDQTYPAGGPNAPWPAGGDGGTITNDGKGMVGIRQGNGGMISFDLALPSDTTETGPNGGLVMNQLNGRSISGNVDNGEGGTPNYEALADPTAFHEFWIVLSAVQGAGTHRVRLWMDGDEDNKSIFDLTAGNTSEGPFATYLSMGRSATGDSGAFDLDFVSIKPGIHIPGGALAGDVNGDGVVDLANDFEPIRLNFAQQVLTREEGDLTYDGVVDFDDFEQFKIAFLAGGGNLADINWSGVPEPAAGILFAMLVAICWLRRCWRSF